MVIAIKKPKKELRYMVLDDDKTYYCCDIGKTFIDNGYSKEEPIVQYIKLLGDIHNGFLLMLVNDEGAVREDFDFNFNLNYRTSIFGSAIFVRTKPIKEDEELWDYEITDLSAADKNFIYRLVNNE